MEGNKSKLKSILLRALFIIIIVIVIVILAFSILRFIPKVFSFFGGMFRKDTVEVSVNDADLKDGDEFIVFWKHDTDKSGTYNLLYPCRDGLGLNIINDDGEKGKLLCNTTYRLDNGKNSVHLEADLTKSNIFIDLPIGVSFVSSETQKIEAEGEVSVTVKDVSNTSSDNELSGSSIIVSEPIEQAEENVSTQYVGTSTPSPADLYIYNVIAIDDEKIVFTIGNRGGQNTGNWYFTYDAPGLSREISPIQPSLRAGSAILYTLTFDGADKGTVQIFVDSTNSVYESSEVNNIGNVKIDGGNGSYSYDRNDDADFEIAEMEVGRMSGSRFVEDDKIDENDDAAVRFVVTNRGGENTDEWRFEITNVPYDNDYDYRSVRQNKLRPGESVEIIVEFENPDEGNYNIKVEVDSDDDTDEENERNNDESERLEVQR